ncbi:MAG: hypothetical protein ABGY24_16455 [bacterium]
MADGNGGRGTLGLGRTAVLARLRGRGKPSGAAFAVGGLMGGWAVGVGDQRGPARRNQEDRGGEGAGGRGRGEPSPKNLRTLAGWTRRRI